MTFLCNRPFRAGLVHFLLVSWCIGSQYSQLQADIPLPLQQSYANYRAVESVGGKMTIYHGIRPPQADIVREEGIKTHRSPGATEPDMYRVGTKEVLYDGEKYRTFDDLWIVGKTREDQWELMNLSAEWAFDGKERYAMDWLTRGGARTEGGDTNYQALQMGLGDRFLVSQCSPNVMSLLEHDWEIEVLDSSRYEYRFVDVGRQCLKSERTDSTDGIHETHRVGTHQSAKNSGGLLAGASMWCFASQPNRRISTGNGVGVSRGPSREASRSVRCWISQVVT
jgi:hypothetical protein